MRHLPMREIRQPIRNAPRVSGQPVRSPDDLMRVMARFRPGDTIFVGWTNPAGQQATSRVLLTEGPPQ